jgi:hypothetical protein
LAAPKDRPGAVTLVHSISTLLIGVVCTVFFAALAVLSSIYGNDSADRRASYVFVGLVVLGLSVIVEAVRVRHGLTDAGIAYRGLWHTYDRVQWTDLAAAHWSPTMKWLRLTTTDGTVLRFSGMLKGLNVLAGYLAERVPRLEMDDQTAMMLAEAREGRLPNVWA